MIAIKCSKTRAGIDSKNKINQLLFSEEDSKYYVLLQLKDFYEIVNLSLNEITSTILSNDFTNLNKDTGFS